MGVTSVSVPVFGARRLFHHSVLGDETREAANAYAKDLLAEYQVAVHIKPQEETGDILVLSGKDVTVDSPEPDAAEEAETAGDWLEFKVENLLGEIETMVREAALVQQGHDLEGVSSAAADDELIEEEWSEVEGLGDDSPDADTVEDLTADYLWDKFSEFVAQQIPEALQAHVGTIALLLATENVYSIDERKRVASALSNHWLDGESLESNLLPSEDLAQAEKAFLEAARKYYGAGITLEAR